MDIPLWLTDSLHTLAIALHQFPTLLLLIDVMFKSIIVLTVFCLLARLIGNRLGSASRHLLWLNALMCLTVLPWLPVLFTSLAGNAEAGAGANDGTVALFVLMVLPDQQTSTASLNLTVGLSCLYLLPVAVLLSKLGVGLLRCRRMRINAEPIENPAAVQMLVVLKQTLLLSRNVDLRLSESIESPVSFGVIRPIILLPPQSRDWDNSILTDVLLHELSHIKRMDWLTTLLAYLVACVYWINPLVWYAVKQLREESEHSCDTAVLHAGRTDTDYAESLLGVATRCLHAGRTAGNNHPLMQTMLDKNILMSRISRVLEEKKMQASELKREIKRSALVLLATSAAMLGALGATHVFSSQEQQPAPPPATRSTNGEMFPIHTEEAVYPRSAAEGGIEGWVHVRFTVSAEGAVPASSISIVDAEPAEVFNNSAVTAATKFRFSPRIVEGEAVAVENVQYVFRYRLTEESANNAEITTPN